MKPAPLFACLVCLVAGQSLAKDFYEVLGVGKTSSAAEIKRAFKRLAVQLHPDKNPTDLARKAFLDIQEAYETLNNKNKREEYDSLLAAQKIDAEGSKAQQKSAHFQGSWEFSMQSARPSTLELDRDKISNEVLGSNSAWLIQVCSDTAVSCLFAGAQWEQAAKELKGVARLGRVRHAEDPVLTAQLAAAGAPFKLLPSPVGPADLPLVVGFPPGCGSFACGNQLRGRMRASDVVEFAADRVLRLLQVPDVKLSNVDRFIARTAEHKVVMLAFSTASHTSLKLRKVAADFRDRITTGRVLLSDHDREAWDAKFGVHGGSAVVFLRGPGSVPAVLRTDSGEKLNLAAMAERYQWPLVPQLRQSSSRPLGCGWGPGLEHVSQAQACAVLIGRRSALLEGRLAMAALAEFLARDRVPSSAAAASTAYQAHSLRLLWLDAGTQNEFCTYHLRHRGPETVRAVCGSGSKWWRWLPMWEAWEQPPPRLLVYKPGAAHLSAWWKLPHGFAVFDGSPVDVPSVQLASWLSLFLEASSACDLNRQLEEELPPDLGAECSWPLLETSVSNLARMLCLDPWTWRENWLAARLLLGRADAVPIVLGLLVICIWQRTLAGAVLLPFVAVQLGIVFQDLWF